MVAHPDDTSLRPTPKRNAEQTALILWAQFLNIVTISREEVKKMMHDLGDREGLSRDAIVECIEQASAIAIERHPDPT